MKRLFGIVLGLTIVAIAFAQKPLATSQKFDGKFAWLKLGILPASTTKTFAHAKSITVRVELKKDVHLKKDKNGNTWFTAVLADQGSDWKWNQTSGSGAFPVVAGVVRAGTYSIKIPVAGIPAGVLKDKMQTVSFGPAASGVAGAVPIAVLSIKGS